jgi:hypothetical protein
MFKHKLNVEESEQGEQNGKIKKQVFQIVFCKQKNWRKAKTIHNLL